MSLYSAQEHAPNLGQVLQQRRTREARKELEVQEDKSKPGLDRLRPVEVLLAEEEGSRLRSRQRRLPILRYFFGK